MQNNVIYQIIDSVYYLNFISIYFCSILDASALKINSSHFSKVHRRLTTHFHQDNNKMGGM